MPSTAAKKAGGIEPSSTSRPKSTPLSTGAGSTRSPTVARYGLASAPISSTAAPVPRSRSVQIIAVSRNRTATPCSSSSSDPITCCCTSPYRDSRSSRCSPLPVDAQRDERVLLGEPVQGGVQGRAVALVERLDHGAEAGPGELLGHPGRARAEAVADAGGVDAAEHDDLAGGRLGDGVEAAVPERPQPGHPLRVAAAEVQAVADAQRAGAQQRDDLLAARLVAVDLEHDAGRRAVRARLAGGEQVGQRVEELR